MGTRSQQQPGRERAGQDDDDMVGGQSVSMSGSVGSPSSRSEQTMATPAGDNSFLRLNHPDVHGDDAGSQGVVGILTKRIRQGFELNQINSFKQSTDGWKVKVVGLDGDDLVHKDEFVLRIPVWGYLGTRDALVVGRTVRTLVKKI